VPAPAQHAVQPGGAFLGANLDVREPVSRLGFAPAAVRPDEWARRVTDRDLRQPAGGTVLDRRQGSGGRDEDVAYRALDRVPHRGPLKELVREPESVRPGREAFGLVGVQEGAGGVPAGDQGQFPGQVRGVHHPGVHALTAGRGVDVRRVAGEQDPAAPVGRRRPQLAPEARQPPRIGDRDGPGCALTDLFLDLLEGRWPTATLARVGHYHAPAV
jgi:hypothetical protein